MKRPGPWDSDVVVYRVETGREPTKVATFERAGVPTVARLKDGRLVAAHQHFPADDEKNFDKVAVRFSDDEGKSWSKPAVVELKGLPEGMRFPFDPTLVPLPDGKIRLYFTSNMQRERDSIPAIHSAISNDGVKFEFEPGVRFAVEGRAAIDSAVVLHSGVFHMYVPDNGRGTPGRDAGDKSREGIGYHATSSDGLKFERLDDVTISDRRRWLGNAVSDGDSIHFFGTGQGLWVGESKNGKDWKVISFPKIRGGDPGAVKLKDGSWLIVITGTPRPGTPSAERRKDGPPKPTV